MLNEKIRQSRKSGQKSKNGRSIWSSEPEVGFSSN
jgi:hypothetical protein